MQDACFCVGSSFPVTRTKKAPFGANIFHSFQRRDPRKAVLVLELLSATIGEHVQTFQLSSSVSAFDPVDEVVE